MGHWWPWLSWGWRPMRSAFGIRKGHPLAACRNRVSRAPAQSPCVFGDLHPTQRGPCPRIAAASATTTKSACCRAPSNRRPVCASTGRSCDHRALPASCLAGRRDSPCPMRPTRRAWCRWRSCGRVASTSTARPLRASYSRRRHLRNTHHVAHHFFGRSSRTPPALPRTRVHLQSRIGAHLGLTGEASARARQRKSQFGAAVALLRPIVMEQRGCLQSLDMGLVASGNRFVTAEN